MPGHGYRAQVRAAMETRYLRPSAIGNALGSSIADGMRPGVDWSQAPDESAAETARLARQNGELRDAEYLQQSDAILNRKAADAAVRQENIDWWRANNDMYEHEGVIPGGGVRDAEKSTDAAKPKYNPNALSRQTYPFGSDNDLDVARLVGQIDKKVPKNNSPVLVKDLQQALGMDDKEVTSFLDKTTYRSIRDWKVDFEERKLQAWRMRC